MLLEIQIVPQLQTCTDIGFFLAEDDWRTVRKKLSSPSEGGGGGGATVRVGEFFAVLHQVSARVIMTIQFRSSNF